MRMGRLGERTVSVVRHRRIVASGLATMALATTARAQQLASVSCDSVIRAAATDSTAVTARMYLMRRDDEILPPRARDIILERIIAHFSAPRPLALPVFSAGPVRTPMLRPAVSDDSVTRRTPLLYGVYNFALRRNGTVGVVAVVTPSMVASFDPSLIAAISGAAADSTVAQVASALDVDSLPLQVRVSTGPEDPRLRVRPVPLFAAMFPVVRLVDAKPAGVIPLAEYPADERDDGGDGEAVLRAVVDITGAVLVPTIEVQHATSPSFALAAARTLARYHFTPAHVGACAVPQAVEIPFFFSLRP